MVTVADPLAVFYVHTLSVQRWQGPGEAGGDTFAPPEDVTGFYSDRTDFAGGQEFVTGRFAFRPDVPYVPVQSKVTLPAMFGGRTTRVIASSVADAGDRPLPAHQTIVLQ